MLSSRCPSATEGEPVSYTIPRNYGKLEIGGELKGGEGKEGGKGGEGR